MSRRSTGDTEWVLITVTNVIWPFHLFGFLFFGKPELGPLVYRRRTAHMVNKVQRVGRNVQKMTGRGQPFWAQDFKALRYPHCSRKIERKKKKTPQGKEEGNEEKGKGKDNKKKNKKIKIRGGFANRCWVPRLGRQTTHANGRGTVHHHAPPPIMG